MVDDDPTTLIAERFGTSWSVTPDRGAPGGEERANGRDHVRHVHRRVHIVVPTRTRADE
jgi:hypothetical protein